MGNRMTKTVLFAASALLSMGTFGAGAARFGTLRNSDWVVTNAWQAVSNKTHDLILEMGQEGSLPPNWQTVSNFAMNAIQSLQPAYDYTDNALISFSSTGIVFRSLSYGTPNRWTDATGCVWRATADDTDWHVTTNGIPFRTLSWNGENWADEGTSLSYFGGSWHFTGSWIDGSYVGPVDIPSFTVETDIVSYGYLVSAKVGFSRDYQTNLVGRVALTNDISQAISTNNSAFVSAVLAAPLVGADPNDLSELAEYGSYGTVGAAILALIAGLAALKRRMTSAETALAQKANATDLPYALVTPGEWTFSGVPEDATGSDMSYDNGYWTLYIYYDGETDSATAQGSENDLVVVFSESGITATRPSLPGHLLDRAGNRVVVTGDTTLTLPALVNAGRLRDFLVRLEIGGSTVPTITFAAPTGETLTYETDGDEFPVPDEVGNWVYSFTENCVAHKFAVSLKKVNTVAQGGS